MAPGLAMFAPRLTGSVTWDAFAIWYVRAWTNPHWPFGRVLDGYFVSEDDGRTKIFAAFVDKHRFARARRLSGWVGTAVCGFLGVVLLRNVTVGHPVDPVAGVALVSMVLMAWLPVWIAWRDERRLLAFLMSALDARPISAARGAAARGPEGAAAGPA